MQICRNCDNLWWWPNMRNITYTQRGRYWGRGCGRIPSTHTSKECAKRSTRRDVEFIDDDFAAIPLPSFGAQQKKNTNNWQLSETNVGPSFPCGVRFWARLLNAAGCVFAAIAFAEFLYVRLPPFRLA